MKKAIVFGISSVLLALFSSFAAAADSSAVLGALHKAHDDFKGDFPKVRPSDQAKAQEAANNFCFVFKRDYEAFSAAHPDLSVKASFVEPYEFPDCQGNALRNLDNDNKKRVDLSWGVVGRSVSIEIVSRKPFSVVFFTQMKIEKSEGDLWLKEFHYNSFKMVYNNDSMTWKGPIIHSTVKVWEKIMPDGEVNSFATCPGSGQIWNVTTGLQSSAGMEKPRPVAAEKRPVQKDESANREIERTPESPGRRPALTEKSVYFLVVFTNLSLGLAATAEGVSFDWRYIDAAAFPNCDGGAQGGDCGGCQTYASDLKERCVCVSADEKTSAVKARVYLSYWFFDRPKEKHYVSLLCRHKVPLGQVISNGNDSWIFERVEKSVKVAELANGRRSFFCQNAGSDTVGVMLRKYFKN